MSELPAFNSDDRTTAVQRLFVQHAAHLRGFIVALLPDLAQVDDVFQETFLTVSAKAGAFDPERDFLAPPPRMWHPQPNHCLGYAAID